MQYKKHPQMRKADRSAWTVVARWIGAFVMQCVWVHAAFAQAWPTRPIKLIVPYSAGSTDTLARLVALPMSRYLGQPIIVENRPGAGGAIGGAYVAKAAPDGYTICFCGMAPQLTLGLLEPNLPYNPVRDLAPVGQVVNIGLVMISSPTFDATTIGQLIAKAKAAPGKLPYAGAGYGASTNLAGELFGRRAGVSMPFVNYKGDAQAITDVMGGQVNIGIVTLVAAAELIKAGRVKALATMGKTRDATLPDVPTVSESGLKDFTADAWDGLSVPAGTPAPIIKKINDAMRIALDDKMVRDSMPRLGVSPVGSTPEAFASFLRSEDEKWAHTIKAANLKIE